MKTTPCVLLIACLFLSVAMVHAGRSRMLRKQVARQNSVDDGSGAKTYTFKSSGKGSKADDERQSSDDDDDWWKSVDKHDADSSQDQDDSEPTDDEPLKRGGNKGKRSRGDDSQDSEDKKDNGKDSRDSNDSDDDSNDTKDNKGDSTNSAGLQGVLEQHNRYRACHGVPALTWSSSIASSAQAYASKCIFEHSGAKGLGENLATGYKDWTTAVKVWYDEESMYDYSAGQFSHETGHFTAMIWKASTQVGCGYSTCSGRNQNRTMYVCQYSPQGNIIGRFKENVPRPSAS